MIKNSLRKIGQNIKYIRKSQNLSQEKLAEKMCVSRNYIGMIERAEVNIPTKTILEIALALNLHPKTFFDF